MRTYILILCLCLASTFGCEYHDPLYEVTTYHADHTKSVYHTIHYIEDDWTSRYQFKTVEGQWVIVPMRDTTIKRIGTKVTK